MSFGGFLDNSSGGGGARIVADISYSNNMTTGAIAQSRLVPTSLPKSMFNSPGLSLALVRFIHSHLSLFPISPHPPQSFLMISSFNASELAFFSSFFLGSKLVWRVKVT